MSKFQQLQSSILFQVVGDDALKGKVTQAARQFAAGTALVVAAIAAAPGAASAQNTPMSPSNCSNFGSVIGGMLGGIAGGDSWEKRALGAAVGAFGGGAVGHGICNAAAKKAEEVKNPPVQIYNAPQAPSHSNYPAQIHRSQGSAHSPVGVQPVSPGAVRSMPIGDFKGNLISMFEEAGAAHRAEMVALSTSEGTRLDAWGASILGKKAAFHEALKGHQAGGTDEGAVAAARDAFNADRKAFASVVAKLGTGAPNVAPRNVEDHLVFAASLLEAPINRTVTMHQLASASANAKSANQTHVAEAPKSVTPRASA